MQRILNYVSVLAIVFGLLPRATAARCGGTERWQVKVGTDTGVGSVQLTPHVQITLQNLLGLSQPSLPADNNTRLPEETHVYEVHGRLVEFKHETDTDYHLVISDDTLQFTNDATGQLPGHSFIAEIPDPNCIAGVHGNPSVPSRFITQITAARNQLDAQFPGADQSGAFNNAGGIPVTIVGIGFFDRPHGQTGRAPNNLEIHPILNISFGGSATPTPDFSVSLTPSTVTLPPSGSAAISIAAVPQNGFSDGVSFAASGMPTGVTSNITVQADGTSLLSFNASADAAPGTSAVTITGTSGALSHTANLVLTVSGGAAPTGQWEYKIATAPTPDALITQVNTLGTQGWELTGVTFDSSRPDSYVGFVKRPVSH